MFWIGEILADEVAMGSPNEDGRVVFVLFIERFVLIKFLAHLSCDKIGRISILGRFRSPSNYYNTRVQFFTLGICVAFSRLIPNACGARLRFLFPVFLLLKGCLITDALDVQMGL